MNLTEVKAALQKRVDVWSQLISGWKKQAADLGHTDEKSFDQFLETNIDYHALRHLNNLGTIDRKAQLSATLGSTIKSQANEIERLQNIIRNTPKYSIDILNGSLNIKLTEKVDSVKLQSGSTFSVYRDPKGGWVRIEDLEARIKSAK